ncbi:MAG TPA: glycosyltransferase family 39 protein [Vicinamibacterales bacterium]|nr:glycosyltransferase family 39 protein [Vicinamibacterales bacterium]
MNGARMSRALIVACAINFALAIAVHWSVLRGFANSGDEYAYLLSATLFSEGRLSAPSPEPRAAFDLNHVVNDGRYYGKYTPGWPAMLTLGIWAGAPWLINPLLSLATLVVLYRIASRHATPRAADLAVICLAANPFVVLNSASFFSHPACLFFLTLFFKALLDAGESSARGRDAVVMGTAAGAALLVRPYTAALVVVPGLAWLLIRLVRAGRAPQIAPLLVRCGAAFLPFALALLAYNAALTGNPWLPPFLLVDPNDHPRLTGGDFSLVHGVWSNGVLRLLRLSLWVPLSVPLAVAALLSARRTAPLIAPLVIGVVAIVGGYVFYLTPAGNEYGPRYAYEAIGALAILMGVALASLGRKARPVIAIIIVANAGTLVFRCLEAAPAVRERMAVTDLVRERHLTGAIVFLRTGSGSMRARDLTRNGTTFDGPVLYVLDRGDANRETLARHPGRSGWIFQYDSATGSGTLSRYADGSAPAASLAGRR